MISMNVWQFCGGLFDLEKKETELQELQAKTQAANFWNDNEKAQQVMREISSRQGGSNME
jgi:hypothetical protein